MMNNIVISWHIGIKTSVAHTVFVNVICPHSSLQIGFIGTRLTPGQMHTCAGAPSDRKNPPGTDTIGGGKGCEYH